MPKLTLSYPVSPIKINQPFGASIEYYEQHFNQKGHPGIDFAASHGQPVYAAHDGDAIYIKDIHGGEGIWLYADGYITIYWHLIGDTDPKYPLPIPFKTDGVRTPVKKRDIIGYADNTGAPFESSGDHLHFGLMLTDEQGIVLNQDNGTDGCIDPQPYLNQESASPIQEVSNETQELASEVQNIQPDSPTAPEQEGLVEKVVDYIKEEIQEL